MVDERVADARPCSDLARHVEGAFSGPSDPVGGGSPSLDSSSPTERLRALLRQRLAQDTDFGGEMADSLPTAGKAALDMAFLRESGTPLPRRLGFR